LKEYKLVLNAKKTIITPLPCCDDAGWLSELVLTIPKGEIDKFTAERFLDKALEINPQEPDGRILKYAVKLLLGSQLKTGVEFWVLPQIINLAFFHPKLLPTINGSFAKIAVRNFIFGDQLHQIALENARRRRSDGLCWSLFYLNRHRIPILDVLAQAIVDSRDCLALLLLYLSGDLNHQARVIAFVQSLNLVDFYELDQYWILIYELFFDNCIQNPYIGESAFQYLKSRGVRFVR
jgi:hypothetical protein